MSNVTLKIGGRQYAVACSPGEEEHVVSLGQAIDAKIISMGTAGGQNEVRSLLFAALLLADEVDEARRSKGESALTPATEDPLEAIAPALDRIATRLENLATQFENT